MSEPNRLIPFMRNGTVSPVLVPVGINSTAVQTAGADALAAAGVTSFTVTNPNPFAVWFKGGVGAAGAAINPTNTGNYIPAGAQVTQSSIRPDWLWATPDTSSLVWPFYAADGTTPLYDMSKARLIFVFGSGL